MTSRLSRAIVVLTLAAACVESAPTSPVVQPSPTLSSISVVIGGIPLASQDQKIQMIAIGRFSDTDRDLTGLAAWESSNPDVATVSTTGLLAVLDAGTTTIIAAYQGKSGSISLTFIKPSP